ncbi:MAG: hypothetical protein L0Y71_00040 [Gemmataceae bacterium]|nr:hypothetical protein [Gemmataceae bacterium]
MNCLELQGALHDVLDGGRFPPEAAAHLADCASCRELYGAAQSLTHGLTLLPRPEAAPLLTQSIVAAVLAERRRTQQVRRRIVLAVALAASVAAVLLVGWLLQTPRPDDKMIVNKALPQPEPPKLIQGAEDARTAMASLTERVAGQTKEQAKLLMSVADALELPMTNLPVLKVDEPLDPAAKSLRQATQTVASGIEPITRSARRAFTFFVNEMPMFEIPQKN